MSATLETKNEVALQDATPVAVASVASPPAVQAINPMALIQMAVEQNADIAKLEKLMELQERWEANNARKAYDAAISSAKAEIKPIVKNAEVDFTSQKGRTNYKHETLDAIANEVDPILAKWGLSYRFRPRFENGMLWVTCVVSHRDGHFEETSLPGNPDNSGNKNTLQQMGSTATYLQRYTLKLALGLSAAKDDDGASSGAPETGAGAPQNNTPRCVTSAQVADLKNAIKVAGMDEPAFCRMAGISDVSSLLADRYAGAKERLQQIAMRGQQQ